MDVWRGIACVLFYISNLLEHIWMPGIGYNVSHAQCVAECTVVAGAIAQYSKSIW